MWQAQKLNLVNILIYEVIKLLFVGAYVKDMQEASIIQTLASNVIIEMLQHRPKRNILYLYLTQKKKSPMTYSWMYKQARQTKYLQESNFEKPSNKIFNNTKFIKIT